MNLPAYMDFQEVIDALSFELPKVASKFAGLSSRCLEIADGIIDHFIAKCSPRDMLSILCGVLYSNLFAQFNVHPTGLCW